MATPDAETTWQRLQHGWPPSYPIAQFPNPPLLIAEGALVAALLTEGTAHNVARATFYAGLSAWAWLEVTDGVNAFRRVLGGAGLAFVVAAVAREVG